MRVEKLPTNIVDHSEDTLSRISGSCAQMNESYRFSPSVLLELSSFSDFANSSSDRNLQTVLPTDVTLSPVLPALQLRLGQ